MAAPKRFPTLVQLEQRGKLFEVLGNLTKRPYWFHSEYLKSPKAVHLEAWLVEAIFEHIPHIECVSQTLLHVHQWDPDGEAEILIFGRPYYQQDVSKMIMNLADYHRQLQALSSEKAPAREAGTQRSPDAVQEAGTQRSPDAVREAGTQRSPSAVQQAATQLSPGKAWETGTQRCPRGRDPAIPQRNPAGGDPVVSRESSGDWDPAVPRRSPRGGHPAVPRRSPGSRHPELPRSYAGSQFLKAFRAQEQESQARSK
ncbi:LOW QUALITY PROTEIN: KH domain-containing protein 3 [Odocoileus virginianus]|uniref:LOW QUALITY PROTEIN: KH domain-containing protein 3 n=1 Tax=Odocoileus virginianus TaxID=9874 RepID=A0ABM4IYS2_ODOVR